MPCSSFGYTCGCARCGPQFDDGVLIPRTVLPTLVGLALALPLAAIEARAQAPAAAELHVVVLATVPTMAERPTTPVPAAFRGSSLYWRVLKSGNTVSYQLCLGFFEARNDAERRP